MNPYDTKLSKLERQMYDVLAWLQSEYESGECSNLPDSLMIAVREALDDADEQVLSDLNNKEISDIREMCLTKE